MATTITFPDVLPATSEFGISVNDEIFTSPLSQIEQIAELSEQRWSLRLEFVNINQANSLLINSFILKMRGRTNVVEFGDPTYIVPSAVASETPLVDGNQSAGATTINTKSWTASQTDLMKEGYYLQIGTKMYMVTADVSSDGGGLMSIDIMPPLKADISDDGSIDVATPKALFRLSSPNNTWTTQKTVINSYTFNLVEATGV